MGSQKKYKVSKKNMRFPGNLKKKTYSFKKHMETPDKYGKHSENMENTENMENMGKKRYGKYGKIRKIWGKMRTA